MRPLIVLLLGVLFSAAANGADNDPLALRPQIERLIIGGGGGAEQHPKQQDDDSAHDTNLLVTRRGCDYRVASAVCCVGFR